MSISVSRRSVFALRCSRDTATLVEWMTKGSILRARNQRANQNPSRPASKARTIRVIIRPPFIARSRQPSTKRSSAVGSGSNFFKGRLSMPGTTPAASQLDWLIFQHYNHGAILFEGDQRTAQVINLGHGGTSIGFRTTTTVPDLCRRPHSFWTQNGHWAVLHEREAGSDLRLRLIRKEACSVSPQCLARLLKLYSGKLDRFHV